MIFTSKTEIAICLLQLLHDKDSMKHLMLETRMGKQEVDCKPTKKLSFFETFPHFINTSRK